MGSEVVCRETFSLSALRNPPDQITRAYADRIFPTVEVDEELGLAWRDVPYDRKSYQTENGICTRGRLYPWNYKHMTIQEMPKTVRSHLLPAGAFELDLKNSQQTILFHCGERAQAAWINLRVIGRFLKYPENRYYEVTQATGVTREEAKELFTRIMFGGEIGSWCLEKKVKTKLPYFVHEFQEAVRRVFESVENSVVYHWQDFVDCFCIARVKREDGKPVMPSMRSYFLQDKEGDIMSELFGLVSNQCEVLGIIHDGLVVRNARGDTDTESLSQRLRECSGVNYLTLQRKEIEASESEGRNLSFKKAPSIQSGMLRRRQICQEIRNELPSEEDPLQRRKKELLLHYYAPKEDGGEEMSYTKSKTSVRSHLRFEGYPEHLL